MATPSVSLILTCYRQERYIAQAVHSALQQEGPPIEIVISDDASPDATWDVVREVVGRYRGPHEVVLHRNTDNVGAMENTWRTVQRARGELMVRCHGDDVFVPHRVRRVVEAWQAHRPTLITSQAIKISEKGDIIVPLSRQKESGPVPADRILEQGWVPEVLGATYAWHREMWDTFGPLPQDLVTTAGDHVMPVRGALLGGTWYIAEPLVLWRQHDRQLTGQMGSEVQGDPTRGDGYIAHAVAALYANLRDIDLMMRQPGADAQRLGALRSLVIARIVQRTHRWIRLRTLLTRQGMKPAWEEREPGAFDPERFLQALKGGG